jgi:hypothetical protein
MENNKKPTPVEWFAEEMFKQGYFNDKQLTISNIKHFVKQAKELEEARINLAVRLGAGSLGQWTPELEEAILAEFKK